MRRWWLVLPPLALLLLLVVAAAGWHDLTDARAQLVGARQSLIQAVDDPASLRTTDGRSAARARIRSGLAELRLADRRLRRSTALNAIRVVPGLRRQRSGALQLIADGRTAATAGDQLLATAEQLANHVSLEDGAVPLAGLQRLEDAVKGAGERIRPLAHSSRGLWSSLASSRRAFNNVAASTSDRLLEAANAITAARSFMGQGGSRRYLIAAENNSEMRDRGMVLSYAVARFDNGHLVFERTGPIADLSLKAPAPIAVPAGTNTLFGDMGPSQLWQSVNATADFAWSGRAMAAMYKQAVGQSVDGVIAIDVPGLGSVLEAVGPVVVPGIDEALTSQNVGRILLHDLYANIAPDASQTARHEHLAEAAAATIGRLTTGRHDAVALGRELGQAAAGGHLRLWSAASDEEKVFENSGLGGGPATKMADRTFHLAVQNVNATKLDYYVKPRVRIDISVTKQGTAVVRTSVRIVNSAPNGPPSYQLGPYPLGHDRPGEYVTRTQLWGPLGAVQLAGVDESGLIANQVTAHVLPGKETTVRFETVVPHAIRAGRLEFRMVPQPRLDPMSIEVHLSAPGWRVNGSPDLRRVWDQTFVAAWDLH